MRIFTLFWAFLLLCPGILTAQDEAIRLKKGVLNDSVYLLADREPVRVYLPKNYDHNRKWPLLVYFDYETYASQRIDSWKEVLDRQGFVLLHIQAATDSTSLVRSVKAAADLLTKAAEVFPLEERMIYTLGTQRSSRMASVTVVVLEGFKGTIALGGPLSWLDSPNRLRNKHYLGAIGTYDFAYRSMGEDWNTLRRYKGVQAHLNLVAGAMADSSQALLDRSLSMVKLNAMQGGALAMDSTLYRRLQEASVDRFDNYINSGRLLLAENEWKLQEGLLGMHRETSWKRVLNDLGLKKEYRQLMRKAENQFYQEEVLWTRYWSYLLDDLEYLQLDNLGWWNFQIDDLRQKASGSEDEYERASAARSLSYLSAMVDDQINLLRDRASEAEPLQWIEFERYLYMLKTLLMPDQYNAYLEVVSRSAYIEDFGTALYYLDLLFQKGFRDRDRLHSLEHTALFRLSPEFNELVEKYFENSRY